MHTLIMAVVILSVVAAFALPLPLIGFMIQRRRSATASYAFVPVQAAADPDTLPPEFEDAWRVSGFLNDEEHDDMSKAAQTTQELREIERRTFLEVTGVIDSAVADLVGGRRWVELGPSHDS